ncbi:small multi-drug export protein [Paenalkalicoccus suaedae]|uniref:Small multi-drug export protein n=1 Tax=Paenalkalicoccus suaedae TaxID=2592382 RepID=A0A859FBX9_9BACI|nr:small multi-drug export protein [Paenalkalicoccus suaedae]QKS70557.1 small multi-drug export protein [Paenalkalicoccus suaedae]
MIELIWQYILIFAMAATPWLEILIVIPVGIGMGLDPILVGIVSFLGNFVPILLIVYLLQWFQRTAWYLRYREKREQRKQEKGKSKSRGTKGTALFNKYGLPGLALLGPAVTGIHLAAIIALSLKADKHKTTLWMGGSLVAWTVFLCIASVYSIDWITGLFN